MPARRCFCERRYGFNQEPFRIVKFRTMTAMEDNANLISATRFDPRVTRIGAFLRRTSIDELPQLLNVLAGDMSLVGPRPHALAHDQRYEGRIARYARRHNVKPGITGWAQVCGLRGEIATEEKMRRRVEHDLYYVDNWSLWLDIKIIAMTIFSAKAHSGSLLRALGVRDGLAHDGLKTRFPRVRLARPRSSRPRAAALLRVARHRRSASARNG